MTKTKEQLIARLREINDKLNDLQSREMDAEVQSEMDTLVREYKNNKREIEVINMAREAAPAPKDVNAELREFLHNAQPGRVFDMPAKRESMSTSDTTPYVQGVTVLDIIKTDRPDADILAAAGVPMSTNVTGNKIQWAFAGGVEAVFANELAATTERKVDLNKQNPVQQRLTVRVRLSNQAIENTNYDLQGLFTQFVSEAIMRKVNFAAASTTKATSVFYGGFAQDAESGVWGQAGYVPGKQTGTYAALGKEVFVEAIKKLAKRNISLDHAVFVLGAEDYWDAKVTPIDAGSGKMLLDGDRILGVKVLCNNAINRSSEKGAVSGHNIGLGNFAGLPTMQHGNIRLSIDASSAVASSTDEVIITINADFSMTVLRDLADGFVVMSKSSAPTISGDESVTLAATATAVKRTYSTSNGAAVKVSNSASLPEWLAVSVGSGNKVTFTPQAYAHAESGDNPRTFTVKLGIEGETSNLDVVVSQPMAAE